MPNQITLLINFNVALALNCEQADDIAKLLIYFNLKLQYIYSAVVGNLREEQAGFRNGWSCMEKIIFLRRIIE